MEQKPPRRLPAAQAMIVAPQPEAVEAGAMLLAGGGNAVDAVLACALTQGVVDPLMCGIGGLGVMQIWDPASGRHVILDGLSTCPAACRADMWADRFERECADGYGYVVRGHVNELGHGAVTTPGIVQVFALAHAEYGRTAWRDLFAPAMAVAREGWAIRPHVAGMFATDEQAYGRLPYAAKLAFTADGRRLYLRSDGTPKRTGDMVHNPELAATLALIADGGAEAFYSGVLARRMIDDMTAQDGASQDGASQDGASQDGVSQDGVSQDGASHNGPMTLADLAAFRPVRSEPLWVTYRGRRIAVPMPPAGGIMVAQMLRLAEKFDLVALGHNSPEYIRVVAEVMKIAGRDKDRHVGDPNFVAVPVDHLLSDAYAEACAARIRRGEKASLTRQTVEAPHTTTISCVDREGQVVSLTHTLGVPSGVIPPGTGFMLNGAMNWYDPRPGRAGSIAGGKRRYSSMTPTIVFDGEQAVATLGAPGGAWITIAILQALLNLLDWGMTMQEAVMAPRFSATTDAIDIGNRIPRSTQRALAAMGYTVNRSPLTFPFAAVHGITMFDGVLDGGADPQRDGYVAAIE